MHKEMQPKAQRAVVHDSHVARIERCTWSGQLVSVKTAMDLPAARDALRNEEACYRAIEQRGMAPHFPRLLQGIQPEGPPSIVLSWQPGQDAFEFVTRTGLSPARKAGLLHAMAECVQRLHEIHIAHGDIKLENFVVDPSGDSLAVVLLDFGMSVALDAHAVRVPACALGTEQYNAPEKLFGDYDPFLADVYSLGMCFYAVLQGAFPDAAYSLKCGNFVDDMLAEPQRRPTAKAVLKHTQRLCTELTRKNVQCK